MTRREFLKKNVVITRYMGNVYRVEYQARHTYIVKDGIEGLLEGLCLAGGAGLTKWRPSDITLGKKSKWDGLLQCKISWGR